MERDAPAAGDERSHGGEGARRAAAKKARPKLVVSRASTPLPDAPGQAGIAGPAAAGSEHVPPVREPPPEQSTSSSPHLPADVDVGLMGSHRSLSGNTRPSPGPPADMGVDFMGSQRSRSEQTEPHSPAGTPHHMLSVSSEASLQTPTKALTLMPVRPMPTYPLMPASPNPSTPSAALNPPDRPLLPAVASQSPQGAGARSGGFELDQLPTSSPKRTTSDMGRREDPSPGSCRDLSQAGRSQARGKANKGLKSTQSGDGGATSGAASTARGSGHSAPGSLWDDLQDPEEARPGSRVSQNGADSWGALDANDGWGQCSAGISPLQQHRAMVPETQATDSSRSTGLSLESEGMSRRSPSERPQQPLAVQAPAASIAADMGGAYSESRWAFDSWDTEKGEANSALNGWDSGWDAMSPIRERSPSRLQVVEPTRSPSPLRNSVGVATPVRQSPLWLPSSGEKSSKAHHKGLPLSHSRQRHGLQGALGLPSQSRRRTIIACLAVLVVLTLVCSMSVQVSSSLGARFLLHLPDPSSGILHSSASATGQSLAQSRKGAGPAGPSRQTSADAPGTPNGAESFPRKLGMNPSFTDQNTTNSASQEASEKTPQAAPLSSLASTSELSADTRLGEVDELNLADPAVEENAVVAGKGLVVRASTSSKAVVLGSGAAGDAGTEVGSEEGEMAQQEVEEVDVVASSGQEDEALVPALEEVAVGGSEAGERGQPGRLMEETAQGPEPVESRELLNNQGHDSGDSAGSDTDPSAESTTDASAGEATVAQEAWEHTAAYTQFKEDLLNGVVGNSGAAVDDAVDDASGDKGAATLGLAVEESSNESAEVATSAAAERVPAVDSSEVAVAGTQQSSSNTATIDTSGALPGAFSTEQSSSGVQVQEAAYSVGAPPAADARRDASSDNGAQAGTGAHATVGTPGSQAHQDLPGGLETDVHSNATLQSAPPRLEVDVEQTGSKLGGTTTMAQAQVGMEQATGPLLMQQNQVLPHQDSRAISSLQEGTKDARIQEDQGLQRESTPKEGAESPGSGLAATNQLEARANGSEANIGAHADVAQSEPVGQQENAAKSVPQGGSSAVNLEGAGAEEGLKEVQSASMVASGKASGATGVQTEVSGERVLGAGLSDTAAPAVSVGPGAKAPAAISGHSPALSSGAAVVSTANPLGTTSDGKNVVTAQPPGAASGASGEAHEGPASVASTGGARGAQQAAAFGSQHISDETSAGGLWSFLEESGDDRRSTADGGDPAGTAASDPARLSPPGTGTAASGPARLSPPGMGTPLEHPMRLLPEEALHGSALGNSLERPRLTVALAVAANQSAEHLSAGLAAQDASLGAGSAIQQEQPHKWSQPPVHASRNAAGPDLLSEATSASTVERAPSPFHGAGSMQDQSEEEKHDTPSTSGATAGRINDTQGAMGDAVSATGSSGSASERSELKKTLWDTVLDSEGTGDPVSIAA